MPYIRLITLSTIMALAFFCQAYAQKGCQESFTKWNEDQAVKILTESAWAKQMALGSPAYASERQARVEGTDKGFTIGDDRTLSGNSRGMDRGMGRAGEKDLIHSYTVRLFSALPIRQAFVRLFQIKNNYEKMPSEQRSRLDAQFDQALGMDVSRIIVVTVSLNSNDRELNMEVDRQLHQATTGSLKQEAYLIADKRRVALEEYRAPSGDGAGAKLVFPRMLDGKPVVESTTDELKLEFFVPGVKHKIYVEWKVKDLLCNGELIL